MVIRMLLGAVAVESEPDINDAEVPHPAQNRKNGLSNSIINEMLYDSSQHNGHQDLCKLCMNFFMASLTVLVCYLI
jgi:hypothetical protein